MLKDIIPRTNKLMAIMLCLLLSVNIFNNPTVNAATSTQKSTNQLQPVVQSKGLLEVSIDPRLELLSVIQFLSDCKQLNDMDFQYKKDILDYFSKYKDHKAIIRYKHMAETGFQYDAPVNAILHLSNDGEFQQVGNFSSELIKRCGRRNLYEFAEYVKDFAEETDFNTFYNEHKSYYEEIVNKYIDTMKDNDIVKELVDYYGYKQNSYNIILVPLISNGYGIRMKNTNGKYDTYCIFGPGRNNNQPQFNAVHDQSLIWHEFSHSYINPLTKKYINKVNEYEKLFEPINETMSRMAYGNWETCVNEHNVRAVTSRLELIHNGQDKYIQAKRAEKFQGFSYIEELCEKLDYYERNRDKYPTIIDFYSEFLNVYRDLNDKDLDEKYYNLKFEGPVNYTLFSDKIAIVYPTNEKSYNTEIKEAVMRIKDLIKNNFNCEDIILIKDTEALKKDLSQYAILCYGTIKGNLWLNKYKSSLPFIITDDKIVLDKEYVGEYSFISAFPNPQNEYKGVSIYTAQKPEDIININQVYHGPMDYYLINKMNVIREGNYIKDKHGWHFK